MQYLTCPRCRTSLRISIVYQAPEMCPRCGAPFHSPRPSLLEHLREGVGVRVSSDAPDWEAITGSQYTRRHVVRREREGSDTPTPA